MVRKKDFRRLLASGFSEEQAIEVVPCTCICNFMDRLAASLGGIRGAGAGGKTNTGPVKGPALMGHGGLPDF